MPNEKIFLSAVSGQFKECRDVLRSDLSAVGAEVIVQEDFQQHGGTLLQKLEEYIASCDRVIALIGNVYGYEPKPTAVPENASARSYTQWEYYFAMGERLDGTQAEPKPIYVYFASTEYLKEHTVEQPNIEKDRQQQFIDIIKASGKDRNEFNSIDKLARLVLRDGFKLQSSEKYLLHNLPFDSLGALFKGREEFFSKIQTELTAENTQPKTVIAKQVIHGLGGVGKTRLAVEYAWCNLGDYSACLFVNADSPENLNHNLAALCNARVLDLPEQTAQEQEQQVAAVLRWFNTHPGWLLILDNVDTPEVAAAVDQLLPTLQNGHVLITSRLTDWDSNIHSLALDTLNEEDAADLLLEKTASRRTLKDDDKTVALSLAQTLGGLALALEQASSFINKKRISLQKYQERWAQQEAKLRQWHDSRTMAYPTSLAVTWETSFEQLSSDAQSLLNLLSFFASDPIPREIFADAFDAVAQADPDTDSASKDINKTSMESGLFDRADLEDLLDELETLSLIKWESGNASFSVHRLVQETTQARLDEKTQKHTLDVALYIIDSGLPSDPPPDDVRSWGIWDPLRSHIELIIDAANATNITKPTSLLMNNLGLHLHARGLFREAEPLMRCSLTIDEANFGSNHPNVAIRLNNLASLLKDTSRLEEAEPLMRRALTIDEANFEDNHPRIATKLSNLASLLHATNHMEEAKHLLRRALTIDEANFEDNHPRIATKLSNLASLLHATNRMEEAEPLMRRALAIDEASFGNDHPSVAIRLNNLAWLLKDTNRLKEAESLMRRALTIDETNFGDNHPDVARDLNNLAQLLKTTNRQEEAEPLMRRALAIDETSFGDNHPSVAVDLNNLAALLQVTNRQEEAEPLMRRALAIDEASFGDNHPDVARDLNNLAQLLKDTNRLEEAEPLMRRALAIDEASFGNDHPSVAIDLNNLAQLLHATDRLEEAEPLMRRALAIDEASFGDNHPDVARDLNNLAQLLQDTNRLDEAEPLSRQVLEIFIRFTLRTGHRHPHLNTVHANHKILLAAMGYDDGQQQTIVNSIVQSVRDRLSET